MTMAKEISIDYYAVFREQRGLRSERRTTAALTLRDLYAELSAEFGFKLPLERVRVAVADEFAEWDRPLASGDAVVFIPPVAGG
jgi:molybdopterin synthase sulfur carrier subunit